MRIILSLSFQASHHLGVCTDIHDSLADIIFSCWTCSGTGELHQAALGPRTINRTITITITTTTTTITILQSTVNTRLFPHRRQIDILTSRYSPTSAIHLSPSRRRGVASRSFFCPASHGSLHSRRSRRQSSHSLSQRPTSLPFALADLCGHTGTCRTTGTRHQPNALESPQRFHWQRHRRSRFRITLSQSFWHGREFNRPRATATAFCGEIVESE